MYIPRLYSRVRNTLPSFPISPHHCSSAFPIGRFQIALSHLHQIKALSAEPVRITSGYTTICMLSSVKSPIPTPPLGRVLVATSLFVFLVSNELCCLQWCYWIPGLVFVVESLRFSFLFCYNYNSSFALDFYVCMIAKVKL